MPTQLLRFQLFQSVVDQSFWADFTQLKLQELKLSEEAVELEAFYTSSGFAELPAAFQLDNYSLSPGSSEQRARVAVRGELLNYNTFEAFKSAAHAELLKSAASRIWADIKSGAAEQDPALLCRFLLLSHAELKTYRFYYWFAFPALKPPVPFTASYARSLDSAFKGEQAAQLVQISADWLAQQMQRPPFWIIGEPQSPSAHPLSAFHQLEGKELLLAFSDPGNAAENPGWPLRNLLLLAAVRWRLSRVKVVAFRMRGGRLSPEHSLYLDVKLPAIPQEWLEDDSFLPEAGGWEPNAKQKLGPRVADLGSAMDPVRLAESAADLNVRLMKWRAAPALDVDRLAAAKCLLLGAGTLGCAVARTLLGWGVRDMTLLDSARVSYSNPVRQSLYEFEDCRNGGVPKAAAAAKRLRAIFPKVRAEAVEMSIPMPGHPLTESEIPEAERSTRQLEELIAEHDVVFLLMDTRESRWLPSLLCAAHDKLAINAALGFDSFLVMRHGSAPSSADGSQAESRLGCYYCNDVVAPLDSTTDRTLDQQCTVARPGLAPIAGAIAVELMAAVLQHPQGHRAPADEQAGTASEGPALGSAPHMIRGQLSSFSQLSLSGKAFRQCTACSWTVVQQYKQHGWAWLLEALQDPKKLEDLTGLTELMNSTALDAAELESCENLSLEDDEGDFVTL